MPPLFGVPVGFDPPVFASPSIALYETVRSAASAVPPLLPLGEGGVEDSVSMGEVAAAGETDKADEATMRFPCAAAATSATSTDHKRRKGQTGVAYPQGEHQMWWR
jgi:hypothetical protein